jgi:glycosyltransferase involved in cell wall biosynthesis
MARKLNVLYLIRTWDLGGSHTIIRLLLRHLPREQFNIITVPYDTPGDGDARFVASVLAQGGEVAPERIPWRSRGQWKAARAMIASLVAKYEIDLIHCHDTQSNVLVGIGRDQWPCACIGTPYGWWEGPWHFQAKLYHWVEKNLALPNFDRVYTVSQDMKKKILRGRTRADSIRVIHTGIDLAQLDAGRSRAETRTALGIPQDAVVVGTVSRLFREKGHKHLLNAVAALKDKHPSLWVLIVGKGDLREALEAQARTLGIAERVVFAGFYDDIPGALRAMDIFAQPSVDHEGFPTAVLEAQGAGLPVIASDIGGTHETMNVGTTGLLVPPADDAALAGAIDRLCSDAALRAQMAAAARPWIESRFTLPDMIAQMTSLYHEAIAIHRGEVP